MNRRMYRCSSLLVGLVLTGCTATREDQTRKQLDETQQHLNIQPDTAPPVHGPRESFDGSLGEYVRYALEHSPKLRERFELWRASTLRVGPSRQLPNPVISYAFFIRRVETRVGPQRHRLGISQTFPWPTKLTAAADAASLEAASHQQQYEAEALAVTRRVVAAYWQIWRVHRTRQVLKDQAQILAQLAKTAEARLEIGHATLADLNQVELMRSRLSDATSGLDERERQQTAELIAAMGAPPDTAVQVSNTPPPTGAPAEDVAALRAAIAAHPQLESLDLMAESKSERSRSADADAYPSFTLGLMWTETGESPMPNVEDNGKDSLIASIGVSVPIWQGAYSDASSAALADGAAIRARRSSAHQEALAQLDQTLARLRDAERRIHLYERTLIPQAEAVYGSVLGGYQTGASTVASTLQVQRELLEIQLSLFSAQAEHAESWARLEELVGRTVKAKETAR